MPDIPTLERGNDLPNYYRSHAPAWERNRPGIPYLWFRTGTHWVVPASNVAWE